MNAYTTTTAANLTANTVITPATAQRIRRVAKRAGFDVTGKATADLVAAATAALVAASMEAEDGADTTRVRVNRAFEGRGFNRRGGFRSLIAFAKVVHDCTTTDDELDGLAVAAGTAGTAG